MSLTPEQARIILLEDALQQAQHTVQFMHGCLTQPNHYAYEYPDMTERNLKDWAELAPVRTFCYHSRLRVEDCDSCHEFVLYKTRLEEARKVLENGPQG